LRVSAPGAYPLGPEIPGRVGRTYELRRFALPEGESRQAIKRAVIELLVHDAHDITFYIELEPAPDRSRIQDAMTMTFTDPLTARERAALSAYASAVDGCMSPALQIYKLNAGYADATGSAVHGIALLDQSTRE